MKRIVLFALCAGMIVSSLTACAQQAQSGYPRLLTPFWKTGTMDGESVLFIQSRKGEPPRAQLLFTPDSLVSVMSATGQITYEEGRDYVFTPGSNVLTLPEGSRIPFKTHAAMYPPKGTPQSIDGFRGGDSSLFWSEGHMYHDLQAVVTYTHKDSWQGYTPEFAGDILISTMTKLKKREPLKLVLFGDSISEGYNASGFTKTPPFMPPYGELVKMYLEAVYGSKVTFVNRSLAGKTSGWGVETIGKVAGDNPDLVILAFGMNDASAGMKPASFSANVVRMIAAVRRVNPAAEFILVATMTGNPEWTKSSPNLYPRYRDALRTLCGRGVVLADMTAVWTELLKRKTFADITGNGVNHPNDFGHSLYAEVILGLLVGEGNQGK
ncbi:SGNH/GDSL hydrolase family protein [bacterium]|nr:SGNH/GDSL hydrolase family protein [bacterium]